MAEKYGAIVIGGGHNGLVCAAYLAKAGIKPLVLERRPVVGGAAVTEEIAPGFRASIFSYLMSMLHPRIQAELELKRHGLEVMPCSDMLSPLDDGNYIIFSDNVKRTQESFARFNKKDAEIYPEFDRFLIDTANVFRKLLWETPFDPTKRDFRTLSQMGGFALRNRRYGKKFFEIADMLMMSAYDFLSEWFEDERIKAVLAYYASIGTFAGPKTPGSAYVIMHHVMGENAGAGGWGFIKGGMGSITQALAAAAVEAGATIKTNSPVAQVRVVGGRVREVITEAGDSYSAPLIAANVNAKFLYLDLVGEAHLPADVVKDVQGYRTFSTAFKMNIAAERPPQYACLERALKDGALGDWSYPTYVHIAPDINYLERAYDDAKYGWYSTEPFITPVVPTIVDKSLSPAGKHVVNLFGGHAPYKLRNGDWKAEKQNFERNVLKVMDRFAPGFSNDIIASQFLIPEDIEAIVNLPNGHIFQGELASDQLFFQRPIPHYADYRTPIDGLFICGSSAHPGGGVSGIPGYNAAREILKYSGRRSSMGYGSK
ncbi:phytoene desaturase family protein [Hyphomicrobium facile]|uniref:Pyridine nucleotide-disulfide oxidoreductase domain-containing protein 2 n=1 Tax=Hyphomicrobium facile TaxID=51670 RepID=A0A1I7NDT7_9HYPH|nr:NAD(P)/FAD-dependent oxidoreductase [Hyphomicrobium facile]SFV32822.1 Phytoene dehydrogenase-related protein [Hyphomicrobium facile]